MAFEDQALNFNKKKFSNIENPSSYKNNETDFLLIMAHG